MKVVPWARFIPGGVALLLVACVMSSQPAAGQDSKDEKAKTQSPAARRQYSAAAGLQNSEQYGLASREWETFLTKYPEDPYADKAQYYLGYCYLKAGEFEKARQALAKLIEKHPQFPQLETAFLYKGIAEFTLAGQNQAEVYKAAAATFGQQLEKFPMGSQAAEALFYRGESLYLAGQKKEAVPVYAEIVAKHAESPRLAEAMYALGVTQEELGDFAGAGKTYADFLAKFEQHAFRTEVEMRLGEALFQQEKYQQAAAQFAKAAAAEGFRLADHASMRQAAAEAKLENFEKAGQLYAAVAEKFPESSYIPAANLAGGNCFYLAGNFAEARKLLARVLEAGGEAAPEAAHWIARSLLNDKQPAEAVPVIDGVLAKAAESPWRPQLLLDKADALYELEGKQADAVQIYLAVVKEYPEHMLAPHAQYMAAFGLLQLGQYQPALEQAQAFLKAHGEHNLVPDVLHVSAESNLQLKQYPAAEAQYQQLVEKYADRPDAETWQARLGLARYLQRKYAETVAALAPAVAAIKTPALLAEAQFLIGSSQHELGKNAEAVQALEASLAASADWRQADDALLTLAAAKRATDDLAGATAAVQRMIGEHPDSRQADRAHYRLGEYLYAANKFKEAAEAYNKVIANWPESDLVPYALHNLAWSQYSQDQFAETAKSATQLLDKYPNSPLLADVRYLRALSQHALKQYEPAAADFQAFLATNPKQPEASDARYALGLCLVALDKNAEAGKIFSELLKADEKYAGAHRVMYELAWTQKMQDQIEEACATFASLAEKFPESPHAGEAYFHVGECQYAKDAFAKAAASYQQAVTKAGKTAVAENAAHKLGWAHYRLDDFAKAEQAFAKQRENFPQGSRAADAAFMQAECQFKQGKYAEALKLYESLAGLENSDFKELAALHSAQAANLTKEFAKGQQLATAFLTNFPESDLTPEARYEQAWALQNQNKLDEALPIYEAVTEATNREVAARSRFMIGEIYFTRKMHEEAIVHFFKVRFGYSYPQWQANAQFEAGRCFEVLKKTSQAVKSYQDVIKNFPESDKVAAATARVKELSGS